MQFDRLPRNPKDRVADTFYRRDRYRCGPDGAVLDRRVVYWTGTRLACQHKRRLDRCMICAKGQCVHGSGGERCVRCLMMNTSCPHRKSMRAKVGNCATCLSVLRCPEHDERILDCASCAREVTFCTEHRIWRAMCPACRKRSKNVCEHGRELRLCADCPGGGSALCEHGKQKAFCAECPGGGSALCEHKRQKYHCARCRDQGKEKAMQIYCQVHKSRKDRCIECMQDRIEHAQARFEAYRVENEATRPPHVAADDK